MRAVLAELGFEEMRNARKCADDAIVDNVINDRAINDLAIT